MQLDFFQMKTSDEDFLNFCSATKPINFVDFSFFQRLIDALKLSQSNRTSVAQ